MKRITIILKTSEVMSVRKAACIAGANRVVSIHRIANVARGRLDMLQRFAGAHGREPSGAPKGAIRRRLGEAHGRAAQRNTCDPAGGRAASV